MATDKDNKSDGQGSDAHCGQRVETDALVPQPSITKTFELCNAGAREAATRGSGDSGPASDRRPQSLWCGLEEQGQGRVVATHWAS